MSLTVRGILASIAITMVVAAIGVGVYLVGPPAEERMRRLDERRTHDLGTINEKIRAFADSNRRLPDSLQQVRTLPDDSVRDPVTGRPYGFRVTGADTFELCADFDRPSDPERLKFTDNTWKHGVGHACFQQIVTPLRQLKK